jgi:hypothetical protein
VNTGQQQGYIQVCGLRYPTGCGFPSDLTGASSKRPGLSDGSIQVDLRYNFQFNPLFQTRLDGVVDVSFMRPSTLITTTVRTYAE